MGRECNVVHAGKRVIGSQRFGVEHVEAIPDGGMGSFWVSMKRRHFLIGAAVTAASQLSPDTSRSQSDIGPHLAVSCEDPGQAIALDFIGLSYESAILAGADFFTPNNASTHFQCEFC
jgi:hypothetical protein